MFKKLFIVVENVVSPFANIAGSVAEVVATPVVVVAEVTKAALEPVAEVARDIQQDVKDLTK